jgi:hypothetical protein
MALSAAVVLALASSSAEASIHTLTYTLTNNTSTPWAEVIFEIRPPVGGGYDPQQYALVQFMLDESRHTTTKNPVEILIEQPSNQKLHFDYTGYDAMSSDDGPVTFTFMIDNPSGMAFRIGYRKITVPSPGAVAAGLGAIGFAAARRRRPS